MKKTLSILLLSVVTITAYADKNNKPSKVQQPSQPQQATSTKDTAWHGTGKENPYGFREYDTRTKRYMSVDPSKQQQSNPYQFADNKPVKLDK